MSENSNAQPQTVTLDLSTIKPQRSLKEAVSEVDRECKVRERCYGRWVDDGKLTEVDATDRFQRLDSARTILRALLEVSQAANLPF